MAIVRHTHTAGIGLNHEQIAELREAAKHPITYDDDCPKLTDEQLAEFRPVHFSTWEERAEFMRKAGIPDDEKSENHKPEKIASEVISI